MRCGDVEIDAAQQGEDAEQDLHGHRQHQRRRFTLAARAQASPPAARRRRRNEGEPAVDELHHDRIVDEVAQERRQHRSVGREPLVAHPRPARISVASLEPGHVSAEQELEEEQRQNPDCSVGIRTGRAESSAASRLRSIATQSRAPKMAKAVRRWTASGGG
jgi:hypothetical protein